MEYYVYNGVYSDQITPLAEIIEANNVHQAMMLTQNFKGMQMIALEQRIIAVKLASKWKIIDGNEIDDGPSAEDWRSSLDLASKDIDYDTKLRRLRTAIRDQFAPKS